MSFPRIWDIPSAQRRNLIAAVQLMSEATQRTGLRMHHVRAGMNGLDWGTLCRKAATWATSNGAPVPVEGATLWRFRQRLLNLLQKYNFPAGGPNDPLTADDACQIAWLVQGKFGGVVVGANTLGGDHFWNVLPCGTVVDLSANLRGLPHLRGDGLNNDGLQAQFVLSPQQPSARAAERVAILARLS